MLRIAGSPCAAAARRDRQLGVGMDDRLHADRREQHRRRHRSCRAPSCSGRARRRRAASAGRSPSARTRAGSCASSARSRRRRRRSRRPPRSAARARALRARPRRSAASASGRRGRARRSRTGSSRTPAAAAGRGHPPAEDAVSAIPGPYANFLQKGFHRACLRERDVKIRASRTITRRQLLRSAAGGAAGLAAHGRRGRAPRRRAGLPTAHAPRGGPSPSPEPPLAPRWHTRPDLRIPALTVTRSEPGASRDPIFIAPYNAPAGQAGAVIADNSGQAIWENPLAGKVTTNFRVQRYRGSPVLTWWEGEHRTRPRRRRIRDRGRRLSHDPPRAGGARAARRPARVRDHPARHRAADQLRRRRRRPVGGRRLAHGHDPGRDLPGDRPRRAASCCSSGTASITSRYGSPTRR